MSFGAFWSYPQDKLVLGAVYDLERCTVSPNTSRYGEYRKYASSAVNARYDQTFSAQWVTDSDQGYALRRNLRVSVAANALFDSKPGTFSRALRLTPGQRYSYLAPAVC